MNSSDIRLKLTKIEKAIVLMQLPQPIDVQLDGEDLELYRLIKGKLGDRQSPESASPVIAALNRDRELLEQQLAELESIERQELLLQELRSTKADLDARLAQIVPLANQIGAILNECVPLDQRCRELYALTHPGTYDCWCGNIDRFNEFLPRLVQGPRGTRLANWLV